MSIKIATRASKLALWQAEYVKNLISKVLPAETIEIVTKITKGDKILDKSLSKIGGKGLFLKELEKSVITGETDLAVHSMKDVPAILPEGLEIAAILKREDPRDVLICKDPDKNLLSLKKGAKIGTSSLRRQSQILNLRPDFKISFLRGNINTRLEKLESGKFDAIILAAAGLKRLNLMQNNYQTLSLQESLPSCGQGILGIECKSDNIELIKILKQLEDLNTKKCLVAEREVIKSLNASCTSPVASFATIIGDELHLEAKVGSCDGSKILEVNGVTKNLEINSIKELSKKLANDLLKQGARDILNKC